MSSPVASVSVFGDIITEAAGPRLSEYIRTADLKWVSGPRQHIRTLVQFQAMKGAAYSGRWGFSVDFVPARTALAKLGSKRTAKRAVMDLCIDPIDSTLRVPEWCSFTSLDPEPLRIAAVGDAVFEAAVSDFSKVSNLGDLRSLFLERSRMKFTRFSLEYYTQTDLCWGLLCIAGGDEREGMDRLSAFCSRYSIAQDSGVLLKAVDEARRIAASR